ncbi:MAG: BlaI/MecI/CopY family transcriptional regulator [Planctomycetota bacterium]
MARPRSPHPTEGELEILRVLWSEGPLELGALREQLAAERGREIANTTVATMLKVMEEKGFVKKAKGERSYRWSARVTRKKTSRGLVGRVVDKVFDGSAKGLVTHMIEDGRLSDADLAEIRALLDANTEGRKGESS